MGLTRDAFTHGQGHVTKHPKACEDIFSRASALPPAVREKLRRRTSTARQLARQQARRGPGNSKKVAQRCFNFLRGQSSEAGHDAVMQTVGGHFQHGTLHETQVANSQGCANPQRAKSKLAQDEDGTCEQGAALARRSLAVSGRLICAVGAFNVPAVGLVKQKHRRVSQAADAALTNTVDNGPLTTHKHQKQVLADLCPTIHLYHEPAAASVMRPLADALAQVRGKVFH